MEEEEKQDIPVKNEEETTEGRENTAGTSGGGVLKTLIFLAVVGIIVWFFYTRATYPKALTEEMVTSDALISAVEDQVVDDLNNSGINDLFYESEGYYISYVDLYVSEQATANPSDYMIGKREKVEKDSADYTLMEASQLVDGNDKAYRYHFSIPMLMDLVYTDGETEFTGDKTHMLQAEGYILSSSIGFQVHVTGIEYSEDFQEALDAAESFGWIAQLG